MSIESGQGTLETVYADFCRQWQASTAIWNDSKRQDFDARYMASLDARIRSASAGMTDLAELARRIRQDCQ